VGTALITTPVALALAASASADLGVSSVCLPGSQSAVGSYTLASVIAQPTASVVQVAASIQLDPGFLSVERADLFRIGDINRDGFVNGIDLGYLLADWGTSLFRSDLNRDGYVDGNDLGLLLGTWG
jgi:hypothetical protein